MSDLYEVMHEPYKQTDRQTLWIIIQMGGSVVFLADLSYTRQILFQENIFL